MGYTKVCNQPKRANTNQNNPKQAKTRKYNSKPAITAFHLTKPTAKKVWVRVILTEKALIGYFEDVYHFLSICKSSRHRINEHCAKSVQIRSFFWSVFSLAWAEYGPEKTPYLDTFHAEDGSQNYIICLHPLLQVVRTHLTKNFELECLSNREGRI